MSVSLWAGSQPYPSRLDWVGNALKLANTLAYYKYAQYFWAVVKVAKYKGFTLRLILSELDWVGKF
jgi:hypothetical protein